MDKNDSKSKNSNPSRYEKIAATVEPLNTQVERSSDFVDLKKNKKEELKILGKLSVAARKRERLARQKTLPPPSPIVPSQTPKKTTVKWSCTDLSGLDSYKESNSNLIPPKESGEISETKSSKSSFSTNTLEDLTSKLKCHSKSFILNQNLDMHEQQSSSSNAPSEVGGKEWDTKALFDRAAGMPEGPFKYESYKRIFRNELDACRNKCSISFKNVKITKFNSSRTVNTYACPKSALDDGCTEEDCIEAFFRELDSVNLVNELKDLDKFDDGLR